MAREPLTCGVEYIETLHSTLYNYYLCKMMQDFLNTNGKSKMLSIDSKSLEWDWGNSYGWNPHELMNDLLNRQFGAKVKEIEVKDAELFNELFIKFPLGTINDTFDFYKIDFPHYTFPLTYKFVDDKNTDHIFGMYEEVNTLHMTSYDSTILIAHKSSQFVCDYNYALILETILKELEGIENI